MTAMTEPRLVSERRGLTSTVPVAGGARIHQGALVVNDAGFARPGRTGVGLVTLGIADEAADNSAGADGDLQVTVRRGTFLFLAHAGDPPTAAGIGKPVYLVDDQTVAATSAGNTRSIAGTLIDVDAAGAFVRVGYQS